MRKFIPKAERNARILAAVEAGDTFESIGATYGLSRQRVKQICGALGVASCRAREQVVITQGEIEAAVKMLADGLTLKAASDALNRNSTGLARALERRGHYQTWLKQTKWRRDEEATLKRLYGRQTAAEIAAKLGRGRNEIIGKAYRMGLSA